jgi:NAD(P)-dependent dehydrogenase (short-subunit alcohol dehydrogenase family)
MSGQSLLGRSVVVTGGGTGIGAACALMAAREGARVTICGRTESKLQRTAEHVRSEGGDVAVVLADVTREADVARLMGEAARFGPGVDGVVANAGGGAAPAPFHLQDVAEFTRVTHLNLISTFLCIKHAVPHLARSGKGSFVGMSSLAGHVTHPNFGAYPPSKAGVESMIRNAADEYGRFNVRFNVLQPGFIATEVMEGIERGGEVWNSYISQTPLGDVGQPEDVAHAVRFLLCDESRWITGQALAIDGGNCLRRGPDYGASVSRRFDDATLDPRNSSKA